jgi:hypothetical protein
MRRSPHADKSGACGGSHERLEMTRIGRSALYIPGAYLLRYAKQP